MNANEPLTPEAQLKQQERSRKRKAILAGGVVLGLGAAATLAAWSDDVFADGLFNTGAFELQGSTNGTTFADYDGPAGPDPAETARLSFNLDSETMTPSQTVYAPLTIATSLDSDHAGSFTLDSVEAAGKYAGVLTYRIFTEPTHGANCSAASAGNLSLVTWAGLPTGSPVNSPLPPVTLPLQVGANQAADPVPGRQHLCIAVTLGAVPPTALPVDPVRIANQLAVEVADAAAPTDETPTTVTWVFNGQSTDI
ncbi:MAG: SipW-dependent-type signal peptide-containing protein [Dietzia sp.]|uniref:SipW-dependent-type signal peptide-containing protein n=1 Tax=Dietzia sp. TaxID=1871616 RepID=UPI00271D99E2|nr:SipW-dependent-type signal peptide-containing protein [Dietzia sp.]MDO8394628.1 SipW-dependent-type signal peptide-containing protein [Dietzia sp.]MDZ4234274.1 SipW-dependent-type signal peptide-containing protein [Dietzia sp.]